MIRQPLLGKKISELRKAKGLTQEELVEKCNISVRTIQRIETGEVTPRSYTVKTILSALDYDAEQVFGLTPGLGDDSNETKNEPGQTFNSLDAQSVTSRQITLAWVCGLTYIMLTFIEVPVDYWIVKQGEMLIPPAAYVVLKIALLLAVIGFQYGFYQTGKLYANALLKVMSLAIIGGATLYYGFCIATMASDTQEWQLFIAPLSVLFGVLYIGFGVALRRLERRVGRAAEVAGLIEIASGVLFLTVVLAIPGDVLHLPGELLEIVVLYKVAAKLREHHPVTVGETTHA